MTFLTPGIIYITRALAFPAFFTVGVVAARRFLETHTNLVLPTWIFVIISVLSLPALITCRILLRDWRQKRDAAAIGARIAPRVKGKWFANLDLLKMMMNNYYKGYPGTFVVMSSSWNSWHCLADGLIDIMKDEGPVFNMNILWENMVFTCQPEHIQLILATDFNNYAKGKVYPFVISLVKRPYVRRRKISTKHVCSARSGCLQFGRWYVEVRSVPHRRIHYSRESL